MGSPSKMITVHLKDESHWDIEVCSDYNLQPLADLLLEPTNWAGIVGLHGLLVVPVQDIRAVTVEDN